MFLVLRKNIILGTDHWKVLRKNIILRTDHWKVLRKNIILGTDHWKVLSETYNVLWMRFAISCILTFYTAKELDSQAKHYQSLKKWVGNMMSIFSFRVSGRFFFLYDYSWRHKGVSCMGISLGILDRIYMAGYMAGIWVYIYGWK